MSEETRERLKPCPLCGSSNTFFRNGYRSCREETCGFIAYYDQWAKVHKAMALKNARADDQGAEVCRRSDCINAQGRKDYVCRFASECEQFSKTEGLARRIEELTKERDDARAGVEQLKAKCNCVYEEVGGLRMSKQKLSQENAELKRKLGVAVDVLHRLQSVVCEDDSDIIDGVLKQLIESEVRGE